MVDRVLQSKIFSRAAALRAEAALSLKKQKRSFATEIGHGHFGLYGEVLPVNNVEEVVSFNQAVTAYALRAVLRTIDPFEAAFLGARVVEQTYQVIYRPDNVTAPLRNLAVAKHFGTFFTSHDVAKKMASELPIRSATRSLLDPCVGSGALLCASLLTEVRDRYQEHTGVELDAWLADCARRICKRVATLTNYKGKVHIECDDGLAYLLSVEKQSNANSTDIIINPPYGRYRITKALASNSETTLRSDEKALLAIQNAVLDEARKQRSRSIFAEERGSLEKSRLFFRACAEWADNGSSVTIISPDAWISGTNAASLRKALLGKRLLRKIFLIAEGDGDFKTVNQATAISVLRKDDSALCEIAKINGAVIALGNFDYSDCAEGGAISFHGKNVSQSLKKKLKGSPRFADQSWITNARGELDQTLQKGLFVVEPTSVRLIRGEHLDRFRVCHISSEKKPSFVAPKELRKFLKAKPKWHHFESPRIVGRQCSYARQKRRLIFAEIDAGCAVGNSCNYLVIRASSAEHERKCRALVLGLLNSAVLDWCFRNSNNNNHVGNYEIDALPFPTEQCWFPLVSRLSRAIVDYPERTTGQLLDLLEASVFLAYGITSKEDVDTVLEEVHVEGRSRIINFVEQLANGTKIDVSEDFDGFFNNARPTLSKLDMEMIESVTEGGNWQDIPSSIPSRRLAQIRAMAAERGVVRTTYYGRLRRDQPAYTINTYFNRPGNGTHIHPVENRTLTSREAARLQSFPDSYIFAGSDGSVRKQIGNAVPPLLAQAVGEKLLAGRDSGSCVDVFCGAGGLSLGLEKAGWNIVTAIDSDGSALNTYALNRSADLNGKLGSTEILKRDLHKTAEFYDCLDRVQRKLNGSQLDLLAGGPPCQGFSHAGFRLSRDNRNDLATIYLKFAERLKPRLVLLENVEGLVTHKGGETLRDLMRALVSLGYRVSSPVWNLSSECYGVPQMRRRVFIVATTDKNFSLDEPIPRFKKCSGRRAKSEVNQTELKMYHCVADALAGLSLPGNNSELMDWLRT